MAHSFEANSLTVFLSVWTSHASCNSLARSSSPVCCIAPWMRRWAFPLRSSADIMFPCNICSRNSAVTFWPRHAAEYRLFLFVIFFYFPSRYAIYPPILSLRLLSHKGQAQSYCSIFIAICWKITNIVSTLVCKQESVFWNCRCRLIVFRLGNHFNHNFSHPLNTWSCQPSGI
jgi:hypothetical protein